MSEAILQGITYMEVQCQFHADIAGIELLYQAAQVVEIADEAIHAMHNHRVALPHILKHRLELWARRILARCFVSEDLIKRDPVELAGDPCSGLRC